MLNENFFDKILKFHDFHLNFQNFRAGMMEDCEICFLKYQYTVSDPSQTR